MYTLRLFFQLLKNCTVPDPEEAYFLAPSEEYGDGGGWVYRVDSTPGDWLEKYRSKGGKLRRRDFEVQPISAAKR